MIYTGLVSVTFRKMIPEDIVKLVLDAGLDGIEWGGDIHVPHGNIERAREVSRTTLDAGLKIAAYGSYYRVGCKDVDQTEFEDVLETAVELNAPMIRVWAGNKGSKDADKACWGMVVEDAREIADMAQMAGVAISFEYHGNTLTDTSDSACRLMKEIDHPNVYSYWQPPVGLNVEQRLAGLKDIARWLSNVHVFHWMGMERRPLQEGIYEWKRYIEIMRRIEGEHYCMLEFVRDESTEQFLEDARTLKALV